MKHASRIRRIGGLAVGLGIGTALATIPWIALADPFPPPFDPNNYAVSMDGMTLFQVGSAHAFSAFGDFAIADGADSDASAIGFGDAASAYGPNSFAQAGGSEGGRSFDFASAEGSNSTAFAGSDGSYDWPTPSAPRAMPSPALAAAMTRPTLSATKSKPTPASAPPTIPRTTTSQAPSAISPSPPRASPKPQPPAAATTWHSLSTRSTLSSAPVYRWTLAAAH